MQYPAKCLLCIKISLWHTMCLSYAMRAKKARTIYNIRNTTMQAKIQHFDRASEDFLDIAEIYADAIEIQDRVRITIQRDGKTIVELDTYSTDKIVILQE